MKSKQDRLLELFFNSPKYWHFEELRKQAVIGRPQLARWLHIFKEKGIIKKIKPKAKMPYYVQNSQSPKFTLRKKLFAQQKLLESGLLEHLASLPQAKVVILFGSFSRADWNRESDIDLFIYGKDSDFEQGKYELKLHREIQVHTAHNAKDFKKIEKLLPFIVSGDFIKGSIQNLGVEIHAKT